MVLQVDGGKIRRGEMLLVYFETASVSKVLFLLFIILSIDFIISSVIVSRDIREVEEYSHYPIQLFVGYLRLMWTANSGMKLVLFFSLTKGNLLFNINTDYAARFGRGLFVYTYALVKDSLEHVLWNLLR